MRKRRIVLAVLLAFAILVSSSACFAAGIKDFKDLPDDWSYKGIYYCVENNLMTGIGQSSFNAKGLTTRAMLVTMLWRAAGEPVVNFAMSFEDVFEDQYFSEAVRWAASLGIAKGSGKCFRPFDNITREELAKLIYSYEQTVNGGGFKGASMFLLDYPDRDDVSSWAAEAMRWCVMNNIITGKGGKLDPKGLATRAEAAAMVQRFFAPAFIVPDDIVVPSGGWIKKDEAMNEKLTALFNKAMEGFVGVGYKPLKLVATQVVAGMNYRFLCDAKAVYPGAKTSKKLVTIFEDLDGKLSITEISDYTE